MWLAKVNVSVVNHASTAQKSAKHHHIGITYYSY